MLVGEAKAQELAGVVGDGGEPGRVGDEAAGVEAAAELPGLRLGRRAAGDGDRHDRDAARLVAFADDGRDQGVDEVAVLARLAVARGGEEHGVEVGAGERVVAGGGEADAAVEGGAAPGGAEGVVGRLDSARRGRGRRP